MSVTCVLWYYTLPLAAGIVAAASFGLIPFAHLVRLIQTRARLCILASHGHCHHHRTHQDNPIGHFDPPFESGGLRDLPAVSGILIFRSETCLLLLVLECAC